MLVKPEASTTKVVTRSAVLRRWLCRSLCCCYQDGDVIDEGSRQQPNVPEIVKVTILSIGWINIFTLPQGVKQTGEIEVGRTDGNSTTETDTGTFKASFEFGAKFEGFGSATAATSAEKTRKVQKMKSTTMTYKKKSTREWGPYDEDRSIWALVIKGVLLPC